MRPDRDLQIDHALVAEVERRAGAHAHRLATARTIYLCALEAHRLTGKAVWLDRFDEAERQLRQFVAQQRQLELETYAAHYASDW